MSARTHIQMKGEWLGMLKNAMSLRRKIYDDLLSWKKSSNGETALMIDGARRVGLALSADHSTQKCYMADTGLLITQSFLNVPYVENNLYKAILFDKLNVNEGMILENIVAQMLRSNGHKLYFYSRKDTNNRANHMEIDFLITENRKISPIEVKSGEYRSRASLEKFKARFSPKIGNSYVLYTKDVTIKEDIIHLPVYMTMFL